MPKDMHEWSPLDFNNHASRRFHLGIDLAANDDNTVASITFTHPTSGEILIRVIASEGRILETHSSARAADFSRLVLPIIREYLRLITDRKKEALTLASPEAIIQPATPE